MTEVNRPADSVSHEAEQGPSEQEVAELREREHAAGVMEYLAARFRNTGVPMSTVLGELTSYSGVIRQRRDDELRRRRAGGQGAQE